MGAATTAVPYGFWATNPTKKLAHWVYLLGQPLSRNRVFQNFSGEPPPLKDLGVITSSDLSWSPHIGTIVFRARSIASWVLSVFKTRASPTMLTLYKSLVRSHLEYCCPFFEPYENGRHSAIIESV